MYSPDRRRGRVPETVGTPPRAKRFLRANNRLTSYSGFAIIRAHAKHDARKACGFSVRRNQDAPVRDVRPTGRRQRAPAAAGGGFAVPSAFASDAVHRQEMPRTADCGRNVGGHVAHRLPDRRGRDPRRRRLRKKDGTDAQTGNRQLQGPAREIRRRHERTLT